MLKKPNRLTSKFEFHVVKKYGQKQYFDYFGATVLKPRNYKGPPKIGFIVPNSLSKNATNRNRIKRRLREAIRLKLDRIPNDLWITIFANNKIITKTYEEISDQIDRFVSKIPSTS